MRRQSEVTVSRSLTIQLPEDIYRRLKESARTTNKPVVEVVVQSVKAGMPPSISDLPAEVRDDCSGLERMSDRQLRRVADSTLSEGRQRLYSSLLRKNQARSLTVREERLLVRLGAEARRLTLRKAYAYALLKWRGRRVPANIRQAG
jgi:hypothetical protein